MMKKTNNKGFSLVELIIVIAIMAILIGVLAPQYMRYVEKSRVSADKDLCDSVYNAMTAAAADPDNSASAPAANTNTANLNMSGTYGSDVLSTLGVAQVADLSKKLKSKAFSGTPIQYSVDAMGNITISVSARTSTGATDIQIPEAK